MHADDDSHATGIPHVYTILFVIIILAAIATWIVPAGLYSRSFSLGQGLVIVPGTYQSVSQRPIGPMDTLSTVYVGMTKAADTVFFVFLAYASISLIVSTGAFQALLSRLLPLFRGHARILVIPVFIFVIGLASSTIAVFEEMFPFIPIFVAVAIAMKYDALVGMSIVALGIGLGYSGSVLNPFTVGIAQNLAGLAPFSGSAYRFFCHVLMVLVASGYVMIYAVRVSHFPKTSLLYGHRSKYAHLGQKVFEPHPMNTRHLLVLCILLAGIGVIVWGVRTEGWFFKQLSAVYLLMAIASGFVMGWTPDKIAHKWTEGATEITYTCLKIAMAKGIIMILDESNVLDTLIYWMSTPLLNLPTWLAAEAMLVLQTLMNFVIPSGSGQAVVSMPIMVPLADVLGISRQTTVLAFQFGDGLSNILWLTGAMPIICKFAKVPPKKWLKFFIPLFFLLYLVQALCIVGALAIDYQ